MFLDNGSRVLDRPLPPGKLRGEGAAGEGDGAKGWGDIKPNESLLNVSSNKK